MPVQQPGWHESSGQFATSAYINNFKAEAISLRRKHKATAGAFAFSKNRNSVRNVGSRSSSSVIGIHMELMD